MFAVHCPTHDARVLLGPRSIERIRNTRHGVELDWRCHCGTRGTLDLAVRRPSTLAPAA